MDEAIASRYPVSPPGKRSYRHHYHSDPATPKLDPPDDEPPSLIKQRDSLDGSSYHNESGAYPQYFEDQQEYSDNDAVDPVLLPENQIVDQSYKANYFSPKKEGDKNGHFEHSPEAEYYSSPHVEDPVADYYSEEHCYGDNGRVSYQDDEDNNDRFPQEGSYSLTGRYDSPRSKSGIYPPENGRVLLAENEFGQVEERMHYETPEGHYPMSPPDDMYSPENMRDFDQEEKKIGVDEPGDPELEYASSMDYDSKTGEDDFIPIKRDGYRLGRAPSPSPRSGEARSIDSNSLSQSSAMRGAQELLKKNRRRRMEM